MIEHCRQILGEEPSSLFGGPPPRLPPEETGSGKKRVGLFFFLFFFPHFPKRAFAPASIVDPSSSDWLYPMTDSSYDSLENELDNSSSSPSFCARRRLGAETLQGSLDSVLTFSDCDQDADPEILRARLEGERRRKVHPLERYRARRLKSGASYVSRDTQTVTPESRERRSSEPAVTYVAKFGPRVPGSEDEKGEEFPSRPDEAKNGGARSAGLEASLSSLSSISPDPARSPPDSPDSLDSDLTWASRRGPPRTHLPSASASVSAPHTSSGPAEHSSCPKGSPPKEPLNWGTLKTHQSLHPNSWLKKGRRLSLTQQDNLTPEEEKPGVSLQHHALNHANTFVLSV